MTLFEGMCLGFLAGVVASLICIMGGMLIDGHNNNTDSGCPDLPVGDRDRGGGDRSDITEGGNE